MDRGHARGCPVCLVGDFSTSRTASRSCPEPSTGEWPAPPQAAWGCPLTSPSATGAPAPGRGSSGLRRQLEGRRTSPPPGVSVLSRPHSLDARPTSKRPDKYVITGLGRQEGSEPNACSQQLRPQRGGRAGSSLAPSPRAQSPPIADPRPQIPAAAPLPQTPCRRPRPQTPAADPGRGSAMGSRCVQGRAPCGPKGQTPRTSLLRGSRWAASTPLPGTRPPGLLAVACLTEPAWHCRGA